MCGTISCYFWGNMEYGLLIWKVMWFICCCLFCFFVWGGYAVFNNISVISSRQFTHSWSLGKHTSIRIVNAFFFLSFASWRLDQYSRRLCEKILKSGAAHHGTRTRDIWYERSTSASLSSICALLKGTPFERHDW